MIKRLTVLLIFLTVFTQMFSQDGDASRRFKFTIGNSDYASIADKGSELYMPTDWTNGKSYMKTLPSEFKFKYLGEEIDRIIVTSTGEIYLNEKYFDGAAVQGHVFGLSALYDAKSRGKVYTAFVGEYGKKSFVIEFNNVGFYSQTGLITNDSVNFQIWLNEENNSIRYIVGPSKNIDKYEFITNTSTRSIKKDQVELKVGLCTNVGLGIAFLDFRFDYQYTRSGWTIDSIFNYRSEESKIGEDGILDKILFGKWPIVNTTFNYTPVGADEIDPTDPTDPTDPGTSSINNNPLDHSITIAPNPSETGIFNILLKNELFENSTIYVSDISGRVVLTYMIQSHKDIKLDLSQYPSGNYMVNLNKDFRNIHFTITKN